MQELKQTVFKIVIGLEAMLILFFYFCGKGGLQALRAADTVNTGLLEEVKALEKENDWFSKELDERLSNPFYRESIARNELQMAFKDETLYVLPER